jgi:predicted nucleic acid-binding protein
MRSVRDLRNSTAAVVAAVSVVTAAELELGVLRARDTDTRARRLATLAQVRATYPLLPVDAETATCFARIAAAEVEAGHRIRRHDAWIAATALRHGVAVASLPALDPTQRYVQIAVVPAGFWPRKGGSWPKPPVGLCGSGRRPG